MADMMVEVEEQPSLETPIDFLNLVEDNFNSILESGNQKAALDLAQSLSEKLNIPFELITDEQMAEMFPNSAVSSKFLQSR